MRFDEWLHKQRAYQSETYGVDYRRMSTNADELTEYVTMNLYAAMHELVEAGAETPWKPWSSADKQKTWNDNRDKFVGELVDVLFFIGNSLAAVGCTDEELDVKYSMKMDVNKQRQVAGYDGKNKCAECGRVFDDREVVFVESRGNDRICDQCAIKNGGKS